jgi:hypothetical protein
VCDVRITENGDIIWKHRFEIWGMAFSSTVVNPHGFVGSQELLVENNRAARHLRIRRPVLYPLAMGDNLFVTAFLPESAGHCRHRHPGTSMTRASKRTSFFL